MWVCYQQTSAHLQSDETCVRAQSGAKYGQGGIGNAAARNHAPTAWSTLHSLPPHEEACTWMGHVSHGGHLTGCNYWEACRASTAMLRRRDAEASDSYYMGIAGAEVYCCTILRGTPR